MHTVTVRETIASQGIPWLTGIDMELVNTCRVSFTLHVVHAQLTPLRVTIMLPSLTSDSSSSLHPAHVQGSSAGGSRLNSSRRRSRRRIMYALSPLEIVMQCPPVVECDDSQPPLALPPVFSEEDMASISSLKSKKARRARRLAITKRLLQDQLKADAAMALELSNSWNPAPRRRHSVARYTPPQLPSPPGSPALGSDDEELVARPTAAVLVTQHTQFRRATGEVQTVKIGHIGDPNYAEVHFWTQDSELDLTALAKQQAWKTQLQFNGRHSAFVTDKYLHSASQSLVSSVVCATCWHVTIKQHSVVQRAGVYAVQRSCHTRDTHCTRVNTVVAVINIGPAVNHPLLSLRFVLKLAEKAVDVHLVCPLAHQAVNIKPLAMQRRHDVLVETSKEASDIILSERWLCGTGGSSSTWVLGLSRECGTLSAPIWPACGGICPRRRRLHAGRDLEIDASAVGNLIVQYETSWSIFTQTRLIFSFCRRSAGVRSIMVLYCGKETGSGGSHHCPGRHHGDPRKHVEGS